MRDELAEQLLAKVMGWVPAQVSRELPVLQDMARYKYDEYQQYAPGERFIECLARWLLQFQPAERAAAYDFVRKRLVFLSAAEMRHLVEEAFPTIIRPRILALAAEAEGTPPWRIRSVADSQAYKLLLRRTLFLGLSDGAHTDMFRRANPEISNEQIWHAYDYSDWKAKDLGAKLARDLEKLLGRDPKPEEAKFKLVCLLDDFTASGRTYLRASEDGKGFSGKVATIFKRLRNKDEALASFLDADRLEALIVIYVAASQAVEHLNSELPTLALPSERIELEVVHQLPPELRLAPPSDASILGLAKQDRYFDKQAETDATRVGGEEVRYGFADGRLPVILSHNTPNNSLYLLWAEPWHKVRGLFPRVSRHRDYG
jgi:hypothetical protein